MKDLVEEVEMDNGTRRGLGSIGGRLPAVS